MSQTVTASLDFAYRSTHQLLTFLESPQGAVAFGMDPLLARELLDEVDVVFHHLRSLYLRNSFQVVPLDAT